MAEAAVEACLAKTALECSESPYLAIQDINVDFKECEDIRLLGVFGALSSFRMKSDPSCEVKALEVHVVAVELVGQHIIGPAPSIGRLKLASCLTLKYICAQFVLSTPRQEHTIGNSLDFCSAPRADL